MYINFYLLRYNQEGRSRWGTSSSSAAGSNAVGQRIRSDGRKCGAAPNDCGSNCGGCCGAGFCMAEKGSRVCENVYYDFLFKITQIRRKLLIY